MKSSSALLATLSGGRTKTVSVARTVVEIGRAVRWATAYFSSFTGFLFFGDTFGGVVGPRSGTDPIRLNGREVDAAVSDGPRPFGRG